MKFIRPLRDVQDDDDDQMMVPDGRGVHVPLVMMDGIPRTVAFDARNHQPGYRMSDADVQRRASYEAYKRKLSDAWRNPGGAPCAASTSDAAQSTDDRHAARTEYIKRLGDAWRTAGCVQSRQDADPSKPDPNVAIAVEAELERWQGRDPVDIARDVERRRRAIHAEYCNTLSNAWRGGR